MFQEGSEAVQVTEWTDRIYRNTPPEHIVTNVVSGRKMRVLKYNLADTVLWNPWSQDVQRLADLGAEEYRSMLCVEPGQVSSPVMLLPGTAYEGSMMLQVM